MRRTIRLGTGLKPAFRNKSDALLAMGFVRRMVAAGEIMTPFLRKILGMNWVLVLVMYGF